MADGAAPNPARPRRDAVSHPEPPLGRPEHVRDQRRRTTRDLNRSDRRGRRWPDASAVRATPPRRAATTAPDREARAARAAGGRAVAGAAPNRSDRSTPRWRARDRRPTAAGSRRGAACRSRTHAHTRATACLRARASGRSRRPIRTIGTGESNRHSARRATKGVRANSSWCSSMVTVAPSSVLAIPCKWW